MGEKDELLADSACLGQPAASTFLPEISYLPLRWDAI